MVSGKNILEIPTLRLDNLVNKVIKILSEEKDLIDKNDQVTIYDGRNENTEVFIDGEKIMLGTQKSDEFIRVMKFYE